MKKLMLFLFIALVLQSLGATNLPPEKVYPLSRVQRNFDFYQTQALAWKTFLETNPQDGMAWLNYFTAAQCANIVSGEPSYQLGAIVQDMLKKLPNDQFEYYYLQALEKGMHAPDHLQLLSKAYDIAPDRYEAYEGLILHYEMQGAREQVRFFCEKWLESGAYSPGVLRWNYNVLMSIESNGILITQGDNATLPVWMLQYGKDVRPDIITANVELLMNPNYRNQFFEKLNIPPLEHTAPNTAEEETRFYESLVDHMLTHADQPLYFSINFLRKLREKYSENLYIVGLSLKYSNYNFDNIAMLRNNYENNFLTDYLRVDLAPDISASVVNRLNLNYIPPFILLYRHYEESGSDKEARQLKHIITNIAEKGGKATEVKQYFPQESANIPIESEISIKELDKNMQKVSDRLYAAATETSNGEYTKVLVDLAKNRQFDALSACRTKETDWRSHLPDSFQKLRDDVIFPDGNPSQNPEFPIQNISYEAAVAYCNWLTTVYNQSTYKKKKFKKVKFRLPTKEEWQLAARSRHFQAIYPWGGYYYKNAQNCFLSNFYVTEEPPCIDCGDGKGPLPANDGGFFTVKVDSFFPNDFAIFNMSGNVAEMIATKGIAMGGSWGDAPAECKISSSQTFEESSPKIGFRVFMEVIEK